MECQPNTHMFDVDFNGIHLCTYYQEIFSNNLNDSLIIETLLLT
jgi:ABC-type transporter MlaC component